MTTTKNGFTLDDALAFIRVATPEERKSLASAIYTYRSMDIQDAKAELGRGDIVVFNPNKRGYPQTIEGRIESINKKTVTIKPTVGGPKWRVQADMVRKAPTAAG